MAVSLPQESRHPLTDGIPPVWAAAWGDDQFGVWATLCIKDARYRFRWIPPGEFLQGSPETEDGRYPDEGPQRKVKFTRGFWLGETAVTQAFYQAVTGENPSYFKSTDRPVENVSWDDCTAFIQRLNESVPGLALALPSEAQWEYACRAAPFEHSRSSTYIGDVPILAPQKAPMLDRIAWYGGNCFDGFELDNPIDPSDWPEGFRPEKGGGSHPVARKAPNGRGLYDMLGNVLEWCADAAPSYDKMQGYPVGDAVDPVPAAEGASRVVRGGSWGSRARAVRAAYRSSSQPVNRFDNFGFRLSEVGSS